jgi:hypothetical protein
MTALVFLVSNSVKLTHKSKKSCNFRVFGLKKYENRKLCVSYVALHKKHVCNLCTHEKNMCVTCVRYLKIEVENTTCVYVLYVWCAVLDSTLVGIKLTWRGIQETEFVLGNRRLYNT